MIYVCNDLHGNGRLLSEVTRFVDQYLQADDTLLINGDLAGARGPILDDVVSNYYKARMGQISCSKMREVLHRHFGDIDFDCSDSLILDTLDSGVFCKILADHSPKVMEVVKREQYQQEQLAHSAILNAVQAKGASALLLRGNGEVTILDHLVSHITAEDYSVPPQYKPAEEPDLSGNKVPQINNLQGVGHPDRLILLIGHETLKDEQSIELARAAVKDHPIYRIAVHYPPAITTEVQNGLGFDFQVNRLSQEKMDNLTKLLSQLNLSSDCQLFYGHYHPAVGEISNLGLKDFFTAPIPVGQRQLLCTWVRPGAVCPIL